MSYSLSIAAHQGSQRGGIQTTFRHVEFTAKVEVHGQNYNGGMIHSTIDFDFDHETFLGLDDIGHTTDVVEEMD